MKKYKGVIAAVRSDAELNVALSTEVATIFHLNADINTLSEVIEKTHKNGRKLFVHIDLAPGIGKDRSGIIFLKNAGVDGIISTKTNLVKLAKELGLYTVQRFFIIDSRSVDTTVETVKSSKADMIEVMPGIVTKAIEKLCKTISVPVIAGGLVETEEEVNNAISAGAFSVSVGKSDLWEL